MPRVPGSLHETTVVEALSNQTISSSLGSDTNGADIDRQDQGHASALRVIANAAGLDDGSDELVLDVQDAADDGTGSPDTYSDTGDTVKVSNGDEFATGEFDIRGYRRHVRVQLDASESTLNTDGDLAVSFELGDLDEVPQS
jgi:hypothetical protein